MSVSPPLADTSSIVGNTSSVIADTSSVIADTSSTASVIARAKPEAIHFSVIVPVYNRPDEIEELLSSLAHQTDMDFDIVIVDDGSTLKCEDVCKKYANRLNINYFFKPNSGRSETRNYGIERATGNYFIVFDSDCIVPPQYIETVRACLKDDYSDCYGGPDNADASFSDTQKAINYAMTSFFTTGGIRGGKKSGFSPRSFNMGFSREVYEKVGGFKNMIAEDIELSYRIGQNGFRTTLYRDAYVYHKRRVSFKKMFRQVRTFGKGRVMLRGIDRSLLKIVHLLPMAFVLGHLLLFGLAAGFAVYSSVEACGTTSAYGGGTAETFICGTWWLPLLPVALYILLLFADAAVRNKSIKIGFMAVAASYIQLTGYGIGMMEEFLSRSASKKKQEELYR
ncbi:MAG: glycosyltransferase [Bacteroidales bacterium]|jgi:glycosyltransferase involved in cell wall biosynthesis|nr:glycosyltransferase [Bacteroidales bacterium]